MPVSLIQDKDISGGGKEILCKIEHFRKEKRLQSTLKASSMSTLPNSDGEQSVLIIIIDVSEYYKWNYSGTTEKNEKKEKSEFQESAYGYRNSDISIWNNS